MTTAAIDVEHLSKTFQRGILRARKSVLEDVSFNVPEGCVFGFLGHNGAGKSTTIKILLGLIRPQQGTVSVLGNEPGTAKARRRIGFLPETADYYGFLTPRKLLTIYGRLFDIPADDLKRKVNDLLDMVGLEREKNERISTFSKGMKQRVGIAQALLNDPELLILDEPASGLDPLGQREIRDLIVAQRTAGRTIFFSSHELAEVEAVCDEAAIIRHGRLVSAGSLAQLVPYREQLQVKLRNTTSDAIQKLPFVKEVLPQLHPGEIVFISQSGTTIQQLADTLSSSGFEVVSISAVRDSLEDTFLRIMKEEK